MEGIYNINNKVAKIAKEHEIIIKYVVEFNKKLKARDKEFFKGIVSFFDFLEKDLLSHFRFEEVVIFPASLIGESKYGNVLMVMSLQKEHGTIENQLQVLISEIKGLKDSHEKLSNELINKIKDFFELLKTHAKREMTDLFPMVDANAKSKALLEIYIKEMDNA
ncbi:MAG: hemerythrin domain-containing protein [Desulfobacteraceae bacterium]|jgi:hemerythrin-like domain-containing protein|nr:hemerythrin domain-containing protein [Desulfobacteraceae bacterium]